MNDQPATEPKTRKRKLRVYSCTILTNLSIGEALGSDARQARAFVATYSQRHAAALFGISMGDMRHGGSESSRGDDVSTALSEPGQVFVRTVFAPTGRPARDDEVRQIRAAVSSPNSRSLTAHEISDLTLADEILAASQASKDAQKARMDEWEQKRSERRDRRQQTTQVVNEALERIRPLLEELGINPQTVAAGSAGERIGVLLPAEAAETLVRLAAVGYRFGDDT